MMSRHTSAFGVGRWALGVRRLLLACLLLSAICHLPSAHATTQVELKNASSAVVIVPNDSTTIPATRAIYVGVAGDIKVNMAGVGTAIVFKAVPVGILNISAVRIYTTGTAATNMVALY